MQEYNGMENSHEPVLQCGNFVRTDGILSPINSRYPYTLGTASNAQQTLFHPFIAQKSPHVNAIPGILGQTEEHARSAVSTNTNLVWGLRLALPVHRTRSLQLAASPMPHANVTLGTRDQMETCVRSAELINTNQYWGLLIAQIVH